MRIFSSFDEARGIRNPVVTTGSFDGVHIGHKTIINRLKMLAHKHNGESVVITFHPHPRKVLYPETAGRDLRLITSQDEKLMLLEKAGVDNVINIEFTVAFSKTTSEEFVRDFLIGKLGANVIVAGFNHHFGFNKEGDYRQLWGWREKYGFDAEEIPEQEVEHETVSSTRIRKALIDGYIQRANAYLDHHYLVRGTAVKTDSGFAVEDYKALEIPVADENKLLPSYGIYAVSVDTGQKKLKGMAIISGDESSGNQKIVLYALFSDEEIAGRTVNLLFQKKLRGPVRPGSEYAGKINLAIREINELIY
jgi:riboflavin kinase/FMN adenylyltransferase